MDKEGSQLHQVSSKKRVRLKWDPSKVHTISQGWPLKVSTGPTGKNLGVTTQNVQGKLITQGIGTNIK
ncbi:hypothetical protein H5410_061501 [Solanum commersonii]|uniref:Uncharacterized protein n=1 Tax=Solanum commersonii TaxID=4109 RepID=A0A9J5W8U1_SOLCO|nr:hypothetical protein H5410_061501 [Solanum commersonii]